MKLKLEDLSKLEATSVPAKAVDSRETLSAIVKTKKANYVPKGVRLRARISPELITCEFAAEQLKAMEQDEHVESIALSKPLAAE